MMRERKVQKKSMVEQRAASWGIRSGVTSMLRRLGVYAAILLCVVLTFSLVGNLKNVRNAQKIVADKESEVEKAQREQEELKRRIDYSQSQEYIEKQLRDNLGLAKEGEIVVVMPPAEVLRSFAPSEPEEEETLPDPNWKKWLHLFL